MEDPKMGRRIIVHNHFPGSARDANTEALAQAQQKVREISNEIDRQVQAGARITLTDPLSKRLSAARQEVARLKAGAKDSRRSA